LSPSKGDRPDPSALLTRREIEVLALAADGLGGLELAERLVLSPSTVRTHFKNIYEKLGVRNRAAAVAKAMRLGVID
jgi:ATP/maltotriose-dependent transcriptional regulator MalT